jgi:hypothetical protein
MSDEEIRNIWYSLFPFKKMTEQDMVFARKIVEALLKVSRTGRM